MGGGGRVGGVIFMSLLYYMFQSILNSFAFGYFFGVKKLKDHMIFHSFKNAEHLKFKCDECAFWGLKLNTKLGPHTTTTNHHHHHHFQAC